jgi:2-dehydropantoate 2-reductase
MRIGVIGAGAIGGTIASLLDRAGHEVDATARGAALEKLRSDGIRLAGAWGEHVARVSVAPTLPRKPDIAFVCTKAQDARAAILANRAALGGIPVVVVQNGLEGLDTASELLPDAECMGALALYAANYTEPGVVTVTAAGPTYLGVGVERPSPAVLRATAVLNTGMPAVATANFVGCQWSKLIVNEVNALPAITGLSVQDCVAHPGLRRTMTAAMREAVRTGLARGVRFGAVQGLTHARLRVFAAMPLAIAETLPRLIARRMGSVPNLGSTLQSVRRGQPTEIDFLNGAVVGAAREAGADAPVNAALVRMVHEVEQAGTFLEPAVVVGRAMA